VKRICAYVQMNRLRNPTGVGRHICAMVRGLERLPASQVSLLLSKRQSRLIPVDEYFLTKRVHTFSTSPGIMQRSWVGLNWPPIERWVEDCDWVYCPAESYVPCRKARLAVTVHDLHPFEKELPWSKAIGHRKFALKWRILFSRIVEEAELLLVVSEFTKSRLITLLGVDEKAIRVIGNGVEDLFFGHAGEFVECNIEPQHYIIVVGGLTLRKGGDLVISLAEKLLAENSDLRIVVVGKSERWLTKQAARLTNIVQRPSASDTELHCLLSNSLCLFFPSRYEGFGIPVIEAMAAGTPAIISDQAALREVSGDAGVVVGSAGAAFEAIRNFQSNTRLRDYYVARGRTRAEGFRWHACVSRLKEALGL